MNTRALEAAAQNGEVEAYIFLISLGANVNGVDEEGTPLRSAAAFNHSAVVRLLIARKANIDAQNKKGQTVLQMATLGGHE